MDVSRVWVADEAEALFARLAYPSVLVLQWLRGSGVSADGLATPELPRVAKVSFVESYFNFDDEGIDAVLFLARSENGEPSDLVAWSMKFGKVSACFGAECVLGADDISAPRLTPEAALQVHRSPLGWLRAGREGVVLLDAGRARVALRCFGPFAAEDEAHGKELKRLFRYEPVIFVPETRAAA